MVCLLHNARSDDSDHFGKTSKGKRGEYILLLLNNLIVFLTREKRAFFLIWTWPKPFDLGTKPRGLMWIFHRG